MSQTSPIKLLTSSILNVPLQSYQEQFIFIVNGTEFPTTKIIADLLSTKICNLHRTDPTVNKYVIDTVAKGDFSLFLDLVNFESQEAGKSDFDFFIEVIDKLENDSIKITEDEDNTEITMNNIISRIQKHEQHKKLYIQSYKKDIEFCSTHFYELEALLKENCNKLQMNTLYDIMSNEKLKLKDEDQLLGVINALYSNDRKYSLLYETVNFSNVANKSICEFISEFNLNDLTNEIWQQICERLKLNVNKNISAKPEIDKSQGIKFEFSEGNPFEGIINYLRNQSNNHIENEINFTSSSKFRNDDKYQIANIVQFENQNNGFASSRYDSGPWICLDFKDHKIIPTKYTIESIGSYFTSVNFLKSWVIETSNDQRSWQIVDTIKDNTDLKGNLLVHTFTIQNQQNIPIRYIRMRLTDKSWDDYSFLSINAFEIFGTLL